MKRILLSICLLLVFDFAHSQNDSISTAPSKETIDSAKVNPRDDKKFLPWFDKNIKIGQSMETSDQRTDPAQFQLTIPHSGSTSYLINVGISVRLRLAKSTKLVSKIKFEYHKNTLTEKKQNNLEAGYQGTWNFAKYGKSLYFLTFDPKYVFDGEKAKSSIGTNILFTWVRTNSAFNWNTNNFNKDKTVAFFASVFGGVQIQQAFRAKSKENEGFILRPLSTASLAMFLNKKGTRNHPFFKLTTTYTGRVDALNSAEVKEKEGYSDLFKASAEYFLVQTPVKVSVGTSFNYGSDPFKGLERQGFWLFTINVAK